MCHVSKSSTKARFWDFFLFKVCPLRRHHFLDSFLCRKEKIITVLTSVIMFKCTDTLISLSGIKHIIKDFKFPFTAKDHATSLKLRPN